jgi:uncharacterized repeat protein (TIGR03803 family)
VVFSEIESIYTQSEYCFLGLCSNLTLAPGALAGPKYRVLYAFDANKDGGGLYSSLILDAKGNLYGESWGGGQYGRGTVFELSPAARGHWKKKVRHSFGTSDGLLTYGGLLLDPGGNFYAATDIEVFELKPRSRGWRFSVLDNKGSRAGLVLDQSVQSLWRHRSGQLQRRCGHRVGAWPRRLDADLPVQLLPQDQFLP